MAWVRLFFLTLFVGVVAGGCRYGASGDRASTSSGGAGGPSGGAGVCEVETCSSLTPSGLEFAGAVPWDRLTLFGGPLELFATAEGGSQTVTMRPAGDSWVLPFFTAESTNETRMRVEVSPDESWSVRVEGVGAGDATLRILDTSGALLDQIGMRVATVSATKLLPFSLFQHPRGGIHPLAAEGIGTGEWAFFRPSRGEVQVVLTDADGSRLVDAGLAFDNADPSAVERNWDLTFVSIPDDADSVEVPFHLTDGRAIVATAPTVDTVDRIIRVGTLASSLQALTLFGRTDSAEACYVGMHDDMVVAFAPIEIDVSPELRIVRSAPSGPATCVTVERARTGTGVIHVSSLDAAFIDVVRIQ